MLQTEPLDPLSMNELKMDGEECLTEDEVGKIADALDCRRMDMLVDTVLGLDRVSKAIKQAIMSVSRLVLFDVNVELPAWCYCIG